MNQRRVFLTGASGFVGSAILDALQRRGYGVRALVRDKPIDRAGVESVRGDLFDSAALDAGLSGCDAAIHLVGIIREDPHTGQTFERIHHQGAKNVIDSAKRTGVKRFIHMSALGARLGSPSAYAHTKAQAEDYLRESGLDYTILRPSLIAGKNGEFTKMLSDWVFARKFPFLFMPYFGRGLIGQRSTLVQPITVHDVADAFVNCLERPGTIRQTIDLAGPEQFNWREMYAIASQALRGKRKASLGIPIWYAKLLTSILPASWLPFNRAQVVMAGQDNIASSAGAEELVGHPLMKFADVLRQ